MKKIGVYLSDEEHFQLKVDIKNSGKTLSNYCKEKILDTKKSNSHLEIHILREIENLLYILLSQNTIDEKSITENQIETITSLSTYIGNLKAKSNKQLSIKKDNSKLFSIVNKPNIEKLILEVNSTSKSNEKIILMGEYITSIKRVL